MRVANVALGFAGFAVLAQLALGHFGHHERECRKNGERAIGAPGYPAVQPYLPCCDRYAEIVEVPTKGWGRFCMPKKDRDGNPIRKDDSPSCRKTGERIMGAPGFPAVSPYLPCCDSAARPTEDAERGYGLFCLIPGDKMRETPGPSPSPKGCKTEGRGDHTGTTRPGRTCYSTGERAQGAPDQPEMPWYPCCDAAAIQIEAPHLGYGKFCIIVGPVEPRATPTPVVRTTQAPEVTTPSRRTCYAAGERAQGAPGFPLIPWFPCCDRAAIQIEAPHLGYGKFCIIVGPNNPRETPGETPEVTPEETLEGSPEETAEESPEATADESPEVTAEESPEPTPERRRRRSQ